VAQSRAGRAADPGAGGSAGTPAGHAHVFADSVLVVDLPGQRGERAVVRGWSRVPAVRPQRPTAATEALDAAAGNVLGESRHTWVGRTGAERYLPDLIAVALRAAGGTDAGMVMAAQHLTQGSLDGVTAVLRAGPVTELDPWVVPRLAELLGRDLASEPAAGGARAALLRVLG
jgi:hypothetical protein